MKRFVMLMSIVSVLTLAAAPVWADMMPCHVTVPVAGLGSGLEIEISLFDLSDTVGDSHVLMDNFKMTVSGSPTVADFEDGTLQGFDESMNPGSVDVVAGQIIGGGSFVLRIDEDPVVTPTLTWKDYNMVGMETLEFDVWMHSTGATGSLGMPDELVVRLLDPTTLDPLVPGINGLGDIFRLNDIDGYTAASGVDVKLIPAPGAAVLGWVGLGCIAWVRKGR